MITAVQKTYFNIVSVVDTVMVEYIYDAIYLYEIYRIDI